LRHPACAKKLAKLGVEPMAMTSAETRRAGQSRNPNQRGHRQGRQHQGRMKMKLLKSSSLLVAALLLFAGHSYAADLTVWSGNGAKAAVVTLCKQFEQATGHKVAVHFEVNPEVQRKLDGGEAFDVVVGNPPTVDALIKSGKVVPAVARISAARVSRVAVRSGTPKPDVSSVDAFKRALLATKSVAFPGEAPAGSILSAWSSASGSPMR